MRVYDDYAHHPTEVRAALAAARSVAGEHKVHVLFQPHLFSRTREFAAEFADALNAADTALVLDIYPAREDPIPGVTSAAHRRSTWAPAARLVGAGDEAVAGPGRRRAAGGHHPDRRRRRRHRVRAAHRGVARWLAPAPPRTARQACRPRHAGPRTRRSPGHGYGSAAPSRP